MKITAVEELVIRRKRRHRNYWRDASDWYWLRKLLSEILQLVRALLRSHGHSPSHHLQAIAAISMNWMERGRQK